jgi:hemerythrin
MALLKWDNTYSVNIELIDNNHKMIIDLINSMHDAILMGREEEEVENVLRSLMRYTDVHFAEEEKILVSGGYPNVSEHTFMHNKMTEQVWKMYERYEDGENITNEIMSLLTRWVTTHIMSEDQEYVAYLD